MVIHYVQQYLSENTKDMLVSFLTPSYYANGEDMIEDEEL